MTFILGILFGVLIMAFGLYYFIKEKHSSESRKIYGIAILVGLVVTAVSAVMTLM